MTDTIRNEIKVDRTALSYWFPKLVEAGIPVPRTKIIKMPDKAQQVIWKLFDGIVTDGDDFVGFMDELRAAAKEMFEPFFLRTDHTSANTVGKALAT